AIAKQAGIATDNGVLVDEFLKTNVPGIFAAGDIARWPDPRAGQIRVEHWVVAQRKGQPAARNILGADEVFNLPPFFWSNHFDLRIHYVGHGGGDDQSRVSGNIKGEDASVILRAGGNVSGGASIGRGAGNPNGGVAIRGIRQTMSTMLLRDPNSLGTRLSATMFFSILRRCRST